MKETDLKRPKQIMPAFVREALEDSNLLEDFRARPPYQKNDYLGWIDSAKTEQTKQKRLGQMLEELEMGGIYMGMEHPSSRK